MEKEMYGYGVKDLSITDSRTWLIISSVVFIFSGLSLFFFQGSFIVCMVSGSIVMIVNIKNHFTSEVRLGGLTCFIHIIALITAVFAVIGFALDPFSFIMTDLP